jgi:hypothetical protein
MLKLPLLDRLAQSAHQIQRGANDIGLNQRHQVRHPPRESRPALECKINEWGERYQAKLQKSDPGRARQGVEAENIVRKPESP